MPLTRRQRADMNARYDGWTPMEEAYFITKLFTAARRDLVKHVEDLRECLIHISDKMTRNFRRMFHLTSLRLKLERIRLEYEDFEDFLALPGVSYDPYSNRTTVTNAYWNAVLAAAEPGSHRRFRAEGHRHYRKLKYVFEHKECAHFPRSLLGSSYQPVDLTADDEDALVVTPISMYGDDTDSEAAAPPFEEVNPLAIVPYGGPIDGANVNVNGGGGSE